MNREMGPEERRELARHCFGCGGRNPYGLNLVFRLVDGRVETEFTPRPEHQGFPGVLHGGITATLLDEAMGWAAYALGTLAFTVKMETKFRQSIPLDTPLKVSGELVRDRGRFLQARAEVRSQQGQLLAEGEGVFMRIDEATARQIQQQGAKAGPLAPDAP